MNLRKFRKYALLVSAVALVGVLAGCSGDDGIVNPPIDDGGDNNPGNNDGGGTPQSGVVHVINDVLSGPVTVSVNNVNYEVKADFSVVSIPVTGSQSLYIWECVNGSCRWDGPYSVSPGNSFLIVNTGSGNLTLKYLSSSAGRVWVYNSDSYPYGITVKVDGLYYVIPTKKTAWIPVNSSTSLYIWECPTSGCKFDGPFTITAGYNYKVINYGSGDLGLASN